jgi:hypothetical protein
MPRKKVYLLVGVAIMVLLTARAGYNFSNKLSNLDDERAWYTQNLRYEFSSFVDSIRFLHGDLGPGRLFCTVTRGIVNDSIENRLNKQLKHFQRLRFNEGRDEGRIQFIMPGAERFMKNDSVVVNSIMNQVHFFRQHRLIYTDKLSNLLEARFGLTFP